MLELAILGLLKERAMHGYELRSQLGLTLGFFWTVSFGSLYPTLRKLEKRGAVERLLVDDETSRRKQVYRITAMCESDLLELLEAGTHSTWEEEKFPLRLAFFRYLRPETRIRLLERRKAYLQDKLDEGRRSLRRSRSTQDRYTMSLVRHGCAVTESDIAWLDELIAAERAALVAEDLAAAGPPGPPGDTPPVPAPAPSELQAQ